MNLKLPQFSIAFNNLLLGSGIVIVLQMFFAKAGCRILWITKLENHEKFWRIVKLRIIVFCQIFNEAIQWSSFWISFSKKITSLPLHKEAKKRDKFWNFLCLTMGVHVKFEMLKYLLPDYREYFSRKGGGQNKFINVYLVVSLTLSFTYIKIK